MSPKANINDSCENHPAGLPLLNPTAPAARTARLLELCVDLLELCMECAGTIDPVAAKLVSRAKDEVTFGVYGIKHDE